MFFKLITFLLLHPLLLGMSQCQEIEKFTPCHFNKMCFCKYNQATETHESLLLLWKHSSKNESIFYKFTKHIDRQTVASFLRNYRRPNDSSASFSSPHYYYNPPGPGPAPLPSSSKEVGGGGERVDYKVVEFFCLNVPLSVIPSHYSSSDSGVLQHLSIINSQLKQIEDSSFSQYQVESLQLNRNELWMISDSAFRGSSNSLKILDLSTNYLDEIPSSALKSVKLLEWLNLSNNKIMGVEASSSSWSSSTLRQLLLSSNSIQNIAPLKKSFPQLSWLDISSNRVRDVSNLPQNLQTLICGSNPMSKFPLGMFTHRSLTWIVLSDCWIEHVPDTFPKSLGQVQINQLDLASNYIQHWPRSPFASSLLIVDLILSRNFLHTLPPSAFEGLSLFRLSLDHNRIGWIDPEAFVSLSSSLHYLNLDNNRLRELPWGALVNLTNLKHLYLGNNLIEEWAPFPTQYECQLTHLSLNGNGLGGEGGLLSPGLLSPCTQHLEHLNIGYNRLGSGGLRSLLSPSFPKLSTLVLRNNPLTQLDDGIFNPTNFPSLSELCLSFSELSRPLSANLPNLTILELSHALLPLLQQSQMGEVERGKMDGERGSRGGREGGRKLMMGSALQFLSQLPALEWIALDHNGIKELSPTVFRGNPKLQYVNLEFNKITHFGLGVFKPESHQSLNDLRLSHNGLEKWGPFASSTPGPVSIDLSYNNLKTIDPGSFLSDQETELNIYLQENQVTAVKNGAFSGEKFGLIDLSFNQLVYFNFNSFSLQPTMLGGLNLSHNGLVGVVVVAPPPPPPPTLLLTILKFLDLSHNQLEEFLLPLCPLQLLDLSFNRIRALGPSTFPKDCESKEVNLGGNEINQIHPDAFSSLKDLVVLNMKGNLIHGVAPTTFIRNHKLTWVDLSRNRIRSLPRDTLLGSGIEILNLAHNRFVNLPIAALSQISRHLRILNFGNNYLEHLDSTMWESLSSLSSLNLSSNALTTLPDNAFAYLSSLKELDLSGNQLRANFKELFHFLPKLKKLSLSSCGISHFPSPLPLPHLISLDLSSNWLKELGSSSSSSGSAATGLFSSLNRLRSLDLSHNQLSTTLRLSSAGSSLESLDLSGNPLKSITRDTFSGLSGLRNLALLHLPALERLDSDALSSLINLKKLSIETFPSIEKYRFRLGAVLSGIEGLEQLHIHIKEPTLSDQLLGGSGSGSGRRCNKLRALRVTGNDLKRIEDEAFDGILFPSATSNAKGGSCAVARDRLSLTISGTKIEEIPQKLLELEKVDLSFNRIASPVPLRWNGSRGGGRPLKGGLELRGNPLVCDCSLLWLADWSRRWLRESGESHALPLDELHRVYERLKRNTCRSGHGDIPLFRLYPQHVCHPPSALSSSPPTPRPHPHLLLVNLPLFSFSLFPFK